MAFLEELFTTGGYDEKSNTSWDGQAPDVTANQMWEDLVGNHPDFDEHGFKMYGADALPPHLRAVHDRIILDIGR